MQKDRQTDKRQLIVAFPNFVKAPKNRSHGFRPAERGGNNPSLILLSPPNTNSKQRIELVAPAPLFLKRGIYSLVTGEVFITNPLNLERTDNLRTTPN